MSITEKIEGARLLQTAHHGGLRHGKKGAASLVMAKTRQTLADPAPAQGMDLGHVSGHIPAA